MTSTKVLLDHSMRSSLDMMAGQASSLNRMPSSSSFDDERSSVGGGSPKPGSHAGNAPAAAMKHALSLGGTEAGGLPIQAEGPSGSRQQEDQVHDPVRARAATATQLHAHGTRRISECEVALGSMRTIHSGSSLLEEAEQSALLKITGK